MGAIFLSASVPLSGCTPYGQDCEPQMIQSAVSALATVVLGRRILVWGGHPAITPMLWASAQDLGVEYATAVRLFQSRFIPDDDFPEENARFANVTYVDSVASDRDKSLLAMRTAMLSSSEFDAAVFIGGMGGVDEECEMFRAMHPNAPCVPIGVTGGAARQLADRLKYEVPTDIGPLDFIGLMYRELSISPIEARRCELQRGNMNRESTSHG